MKKVTIYTDGACSGNPGPGGWGALLMYGEHEKELGGGEAETTNNRMEMMAAIRALESLKQPCDITLYTDSQYVMKGITEWMKGWERNGWRTADRKPVKNADLWQELARQTHRHKIQWKWVRGHNGDVHNERVDAIARAHVPDLSAI